MKEVELGVEGSKGRLYCPTRCVMRKRAMFESYMILEYGPSGGHDWKIEHEGICTPCGVETFIN